MSDRIMVSILRTSLWHLWTVFDRRETHPTRQADVRRIDTIILPFLTVGKHIQHVRRMSEELIPSFSRFLKLEVKKALGIPVHPRPSSSPDLNPIENVWSVIKQRIKACSMFPSTIEEMKVAVQEEWDRLQPADFNKYIDSMPERLQQLKERRGMQTQY
jgi:hypothetical protein